MADMPSDFWSGWIIILTVTSLVALAWMVVSIYFHSSHKLEENGEGADPVWDENLREGSTAPPLWWFWLILGAMVFSVIYLMLYPGLGSFKGILNWSQDSRLKSSYTAYNNQFEQARNAVGSSTLEQLQSDSALMKTAETVFSRNCEACHGIGGNGQDFLFPDLNDEDWQWGGSAEQIENSIRQGRVANMVSWQSALGDTGVAEVADYILNFGNQAEDHAGKSKYQKFCVACHGIDGKGNQQMGAPNLSDDTWLYGGSKKALVQTISEGRNGIMPAFGSRLDDTQVRLLVAWLTR